MQPGCIYFFIYLPHICEQMKKEIKNIIAYMLLTTSFAIFFHSVIPHDHHYNINCDLSHHNHQHEKGEEAPVHCHFFNEIIVDKAFSAPQYKVQKIIPVDFVFAYIVNLRFTKPEQKIHYFYEQNQSFDYFVCIENSPTRGSPIV